MSSSYYTTYSTSYAPSTTASAGIFGVIASLGIIFFLFSLIISVLMIVSLWKIFKKAGEPGWAVIIPIYNVIVDFLPVIFIPILAFGNATYVGDNNNNNNNNNINPQNGFNNQPMQNPIQQNPMQQNQAMNNNMGYQNNQGMPNQPMQGPTQPMNNNPQNPYNNINNNNF